MQLASTPTKVLVVEDEHLIAKDLQTTLRRLGYAVPATAASGEIALRLASELRPDLVLMDINLGGTLDGIDTAGALRSRMNVPIVYLTAYADDETVKRARDTEPFGYILKPFNERELKSTVEIAIFKHAMETRLRERERWFSTTLRSIHDGVITTDVGGRVTFVNTTAVRLTSLEVNDDAPVSLSDARCFVNEATGESLADPIARALGAEATRALPPETAAVDRDGRREPVEGTVAPIVDEEGRSLGAVVVFRAVGERRRAENDLRESEERYRHLNTELEARIADRTTELRAANLALQRANRAKDGFLASMSHELRTPLNAVLGLSEALGDGVYGDLDDVQRNALRKIEESGRHLLSLITDILDLSKIEAGKVDLVIQRIDAGEVCRASLRMIHEAARRKHQTVALHLRDDLAFVEADERALRQILLNLLTNAVKFTHEGGSIVLEVSNDDASNTVQFSVSDNGIGIAPEDVERLFQPFVQLDSSLSRAHTGTGLGLALVRRLAELHGGRVELTSAPGMGSRFSVILPQRRGPGNE